MFPLIPCFLSEVFNSNKGDTLIFIQVLLY